VDGHPILSVYRHLSSVERGIAKDVALPAGTTLGTLGDDPSNPGDPIHLHFELWNLESGLKYPEVTFDPAQVMGVWRMLRLPEGDLTGGGVLVSTGGSGVGIGLGLLAVSAGIVYIGAKR